MVHEHGALSLSALRAELAGAGRTDAALAY